MTADIKARSDSFIATVVSTPIRNIVITIVISLSAVRAQTPAQTQFNDPMTIPPPTNTFSASPLPDPGSWPGVPMDWCSTARQFPQWITNNLTGDVTTQIRHIIHVGSGLNYLDSNNSWQPSEDLITLTSGGGAASLHAPSKTYFSPTISPTPEDAIRMVTKSNLVFTTYPMGVYYFDPSTGKELLLAALQESVPFTYQAPNRILYPSAFHSDLLEADLRITCTKAAVECDTIITHQPKVSPQDVSMDPSTTLLQVRHAWRAPVAPILVPRQTPNGLADTSIDFGDILFSPGRSFAWDGGKPIDTNTPAGIAFFSFDNDGTQEQVGKTWQIGTNGNASILTESVLWSDVQTKLAQLPLMARAETTPGGEAPPPAQKGAKPTVPSEEPIKLASTSKNCSGFVLDWIIVSASYGYTFQSYNSSSNNTYWLQTNVAFNGTVTFDTNCIIKRAPNTTLTLYDQVVCNGTCQAPSIITEQDDNMYGEQLSQNCASTDTAVALFSYARGENITGMNIRYAGTGIEFYGECCTDDRTLKDSTLEFCTTGAYDYECQITLQNSAVSNVTTPTSTGTGGSFYGSWGSTCNQVSLESAVVAGMQTLTQSHYSSNYSIFTGSAPNNFKYNTNCWFYGLKGYTALSPWNSCNNGTGGGTLITPRHAITVEHTDLTNCTLTFVGKDNVNYQLFCTNHYYLGGGDAVSSILLLEFSNAVPPSDFDFVRILPTNFLNKLTFDMTSYNFTNYDLDGCFSKYLPCIGCTQDKAAFSCDMYYSAPWLTPSIWFSSYTFIDMPRGGDSGNPIFVVINNELVLIGPWARRLYNYNDDLATFYSVSGTPENDHTAYAGFQFTVTGGSFNLGALGVDELERYMLSGNSGTHTLALVDASNPSNKWETSVTMNQSIAPLGTFTNAFLPVGIGNPYPTLYKGSNYYLMSYETNGGDYWYTYSDTTLNDTMGTINAAAGSSDLIHFLTYSGSSNESFVPVNLHWFSRPIYGTTTMAGAEITKISTIVNSNGYSVSTIDLSSFPDHIR